MKLAWPLGSVLNVNELRKVTINANAKITIAAAEVLKSEEVTLPTTKNNKPPLFSECPRLAQKPVIVPKTNPASKRRDSGHCWRTDIELVQHMREAGIVCELWDGLQAATELIRLRRAFCHQINDRNEKCPPCITVVATVMIGQRMRVTRR